MSFLGGLRTGAQAGAVKAKILVCQGCRCALVPADPAAAFMNGTNPGADLDFVSDGHAAHSFTNALADDALNTCNSYDARADTGFSRAMRAFLKWLFT